MSSTLNNSIPTRPGRPRRYDLAPLEGFASADVALAAAALDELRERLFDLIDDLGPEALDFVPAGTTNSMAMLTIHMAWAEAGWVKRITGISSPLDLDALLEPGHQDSTTGDLPPFSVRDVASTLDLVDACLRVRNEVTLPALSTLEDIDIVVPDPKRPMTVRGVLMHLIWHWTYHAGQVGLLRRLYAANPQAAQRYQWTFDQTVG